MSHDLRRVRSLVAGRRAAWILTAVLALGLPGAVAQALASSSPPRASSAGAVSEHVVLKLVKRTGSTKFQHSGRATGTIAGSVRSKITLSHAVVLQGTVTITTSKGKLNLKVDGRARSLALRTRFNGSATMAGGTGRFAHARGSGKFTGVVNRDTWAATIDSTGSLSY